jgi:hypothetical protein
VRSIDLLCIFLLLAFGAVAQNAPTVEQAQAACGPLSTNFSVKTSNSQKPMPQPESGKAMIYVIEDWEPADTGRMSRPALRVGMDGNWMGATQGDSYLYFSADPGPRHLCISNQSPIRSYGRFIYLTAVYGLDSKPDRAYYFRARMPRGETSTFFSLILEPLNVDEARLLMAQYAHATSNAIK